MPKLLPISQAALGRHALIAGLTALAYALAALLSLKLSAYVADVAAAVWLAAGIGAAASLRFGVAGALGVLVGSFLANSVNSSSALALMIGMGAASGALSMHVLARRYCPLSLSLGYVSSVAKFALLVAPLGSLVSAVVGVTSLHLINGMPAETIPKAMWVWWLGDMLGILLVTPLLLTFFRQDSLPLTRRARVEGLMLVLTMIGLAYLMVVWAAPVRPAEIVLFVLLPGVLWAALRFLMPGASLVIFLSAPVVLAIAFSTHGGIQASTAAQDVFALQVSMMIMAMAGLFVASALSERRDSEMRLDMLANHDPLTGLPNRSYFQDFLAHTLARAQRERYQVSLLFIDLDRFKHINDSQGHEVGDQVLRIVASRLDEQLRADDFVARLGGDEFAVVLMHPPASRAAARVAAKLIESLSESFKINQRRYAIGASIGISVYPDDGQDGNALLRQADLAMYQAKERQSGYEYYSEAMNANARQQLRLESGLRQAIAHDELALFYQPKIDLASGRVVGIEALMRWLNRSGKPIGPDQFIPVAEETGLIVPMGRWALREACTQWMSWQDAGLDPPPVAVNLSPRQFRDMRLIDDIDAILAETGMPRGMLNVEVTESAAMDDPGRTSAMLAALRERGIQVYIDDFGSGHSNLVQLKRMPIDALKIDKSLTDDVLNDDDDAQIAAVIIRLAHALKLRVVAEGVETQEQVAFLKDCGCDEIQGYVVSRPLPADKVERLFAQIFLAPQP